jgi:hypothetical protein
VRKPLGETVMRRFRDAHAVRLLAEVREALARRSPALFRGWPYV